MRKQGEIVEGLRERYERVIVEDKGDVFNNDLTQALELGFLLELARVHGRGRHRAEREPRCARPAPRLSRPRRRELSEAYAGHDGGRPAEGRLETRDHDQVATPGKDLLRALRAGARHQARRRSSRAEDLALRRGDRREGAEALRGRGARLGDAARRARHHQGPARRDARVSQELPDDDLRLLRHAHGRRRRPRLQDAHVRHREVRSRAGDLADGESAGGQGSRRRHGSVLGQDPAR